MVGSGIRRKLTVSCDPHRMWINLPLRNKEQGLGGKVSGVSKSGNVCFVCVGERESARARERARERAPESARGRGRDRKRGIGVGEERERAWEHVPSCSCFPSLLLLLFLRLHTWLAIAGAALGEILLCARLTWAVCNSIFMFAIAACTCTNKSFTKQILNLSAIPSTTP